MNGGAFGFSRKEIIWFAVILFTSLVLLIFCVTRIVSKYYHYSENAHAKIKSYSNDLWNLQEIAIFSVNMQRNSLNLIVYANNKQELENMHSAIERNRDSLVRMLALLEKQQSLDPDSRKKIVNAGNVYLEVNAKFRQMIADSVNKDAATDFNVRQARPALRKLSDLTRETSKSITANIQKITVNRLAIFSLYEFWILLIVLLPYVYFFYRFVSLFIKVLFWN